MLTKIWLINALMAFFVVFLGFKAYGVWVHGNNGFDISEMTQKPAKSIHNQSEKLLKRNIPSESKYEVLMSMNLFAPERTEIIPEAAKPDKTSIQLSAADQKKVEQYFKEFTLYGLVITNDSAEALVSHPVANSVLGGRKTAIPKNRRRNTQRPTTKMTKWVRAGDTLGDFKVMSIQPDRVLLKAGDQSYDLLLYDKENLKKRTAANLKTGPNVVGLSVEPEAGPNVAKVPAKTPIVNAKGQSTIPLPAKKEASGAVVTKTLKSQK